MIPSRLIGSAVILDLPNRIESDKLQGQINTLLSSNQNKIAINLANISFIESSGLGALVSAYKLCDDSGGNIVFYSMQPYVRKLVEITKLDNVLKILGDEQEAVSALN